MERDSRLRNATAMLGLLKSNEEKLEKQTKILIKTSKQYAQEVFSTHVNDWTPFHAFAMKGCRKLVKMALKTGVDVNLQMGQPEGIPGKCSALHLAANRGDVSIITVLLQNGANVNQLDTTNRTPIHYASSAGNTLAVKTLQRAGANINQSVRTPRITTKSAINPSSFVIPFVCVGKRPAST